MAATVDTKGAEKSSRLRMLGGWVIHSTRYWVDYTLDKILDGYTYMDKILGGWVIHSTYDKVRCSRLARSLELLSHYFFLQRHSCIIIAVVIII